MRLLIGPSLLNTLKCMRGTGYKKPGRVSIVSITVLLLILLSSSCALAMPVKELQVSPQNPHLGDIVTITGKVGPGETVTTSVTYSTEVLVSNGMYTYGPKSISIPKGTSAFSVTAKNVNSLTMSTKVFSIFALSKSAHAAGNKATISGPGVPAGNYDLTISGNAQGKNPVQLSMAITMDIKADASGNLKYSYDTTNLLPGKFTIEVGNKAETVTLT